MALAGQKADGYLARPAESIPSLRGILERLRDIGGRRRPRPRLDRDRRLPALAGRRDPPRGAQPGQARAVRHLHDVGPVRRRRCGAPASSASCATGSRPPGGPRTTTTAGKLIPDELLDAFMLCGTREDVAAGAMAYHARPGWTCRSSSRSSRRSARSTSSSPRRRSTRRRTRRRRLEPGAPRRVGSRHRSAEAARSQARSASPTTAARPPATAARRGRRALRDPPAVRFTASVVPVVAGGALACVDGLFDWAPFLAALLGGGAPPHRDQHGQRDLRRPQGHRHDHLAARQPRASSRAG